MVLCGIHSALVHRSSAVWVAWAESQQCYCLIKTVPFAMRWSQSGTSFDGLFTVVRCVRRRAISSSLVTVKQ